MNLLRAVPVLQIALVSLLLMSCATPISRSVDVELVLPQGAIVESVRSDQRLLMVSTLQEVMPTYPAALLSGREEIVQVCLEATIDVGGELTDIENSNLTNGCMSAGDERFILYFTAVKEALEQWVFLAAAVCSFPIGVAPNAECEGQGVHIEPVPVRLPLVFTFKQSGGRASVSGRQT